MRTGHPWFDPCDDPQSWIVWISSCKTPYQPAGFSQKVSHHVKSADIFPGSTIIFSWSNPHCFSRSTQRNQRNDRFLQPVAGDRGTTSPAWGVDGAWGSSLMSPSVCTLKHAALTMIVDLFNHLLAGI